jgi:hypothetical protein
MIALQSSTDDRAPAAPDLPALEPWSKIRLHWRVPGYIALAQEVRLC